MIEQSKAQNKDREIIGKTPDVAALASAPQRDIHLHLIDSL